MFNNFNESCVIVGGFGLTEFKPGKISKKGDELKINYSDGEQSLKVSDIKNVETVGELTFRRMIKTGEVQAKGYLNSLMYDTYYNELMDGANLSFSFLIFTLNNGEGFVIRTGNQDKITKRLGFWEYKPFKEPEYNKELLETFEKKIEEAKNAKYALSGMYLGGTTEFQARQEHLIYLTEDEIIVDRQQFFKQAYADLVILEIPYKNIKKVEKVKFTDVFKDALVGTNGYFGFLELAGRMNIEKYPEAYSDRFVIKVTYDNKGFLENYLIETNRIGKEELAYLKEQVQHN